MSAQRAGGIAWTDVTWNPVRGCARVSEGCRNCYAERMAARFCGPGQPYEGLAHRVAGEARWTGQVRLVPEKLGEPLRWRRPRKVFVNSMSDLFHESLSDVQIASVFGVMAAASRHTFQVLTKRPGRMLAWAAWAAQQGEELLASVGEPPPSGSPVGGALAVLTGEDALGRCGFATACHASWPLPNVWLGVSVEDQRTADERIPLLLQTPAAVRWVSYEPALGPVFFGMWLLGTHRPCHGCTPDGAFCGGHYVGPALDWVVVGGESGSRARVFDLAWASSVVDECRAARVPVFVKQLGARPITSVTGEFRTHRGNRQVAFRGPKLASPSGSDPEEWPKRLRVREWPR